MLFSSVGFMKAQGASEPIKITVPKDESVTITLKSATFKFKRDSYPVIYNGSKIVTPVETSYGTSTITWSLKPNELTEYQLSTATNTDKWGELTLSLDGKVTSFAVTGSATNEFQKLIFMERQRFLNPV